MKSLSMLAGIAVVSWGIVASVHGADPCEAEHISSRGMPTMHIAGYDQIESKLDEPTEVEFIETPLQDVIDFLKAKHHLEIQMDGKAFEEAAIATDTPITRNIKGISLRSALKLMLRDYDLTFIIRDEVLLITAKVTAEAIPTARIYQVCDLLSKEENETSSKYDELMAVIQATVTPTFWNEVGGPGTMKPLPIARVLVVYATAEVHEEVEGLLATIRMARDAQKAQ
ncbi:MAG TPA: STN domain-containing protein [Pirellulales bacterium]|jgi:hypothetical protein|nr:STN domain-containing protein [Pirellulales bacterium]